MKKFIVQPKYVWSESRATKAEKKRYKYINIICMNEYTTKRNGEYKTNIIIKFLNGD